MNEMIERLMPGVLWLLPGSYENGKTVWDDTDRARARLVVRDILKELRDNPTEAMISAADGTVPDGIEPISVLAWRAALDKALEG